MLRYATVFAALLPALASAQTARITEAQLLDRIKGGWAGQIVGVTVGAPTEFRAKGALYAKPVEWKPEAAVGALDQDDLYVEMTFAKVMDDKGLDASAVEYGKAFADSGYRLWHANFAGRLNVGNGIMPPDSGSPKYNVHADDIDFQIEADFIGLMCPGMPRTCNEYCDRIGHVMNYGDGVYGGMFIAAMYAAAFFETDVEKVVDAGLAVVPPESEFHQAVRDVVAWHRQMPGDPDAIWKRFEKKWANTDVCPEGAVTPYDIDAKTNAAYVAIGLLCGDGDLQKTIDAAIRCGQDSDCNPASAAGVLGTMCGYAKLPAEWRAEIEKMQDRKFSYTDYSFRSVCESTLKRAKALAVRGGGKVEDGEVLIVRQAPRPAALEQWTQDRAAAKVNWKDMGFKYVGTWNEDKGRRSKQAGDRAEFTFEGTGAMIIGPYAADNGIAEILVDGKKDRRVNLFFDNKKYNHGPRVHESIFHVMGLPRGRHTVTVVVTGEKSEKATDAYVTISGAVIFDGPEKR